MKATIGIDIGTSAVKVVALALGGQDVLAESVRPYPTHTLHPGWVEQSPQDWWRAVSEAVGEITGKLGRTEIAGVGLSGQVNGFLLLDEADAPLGNAIIWLDTRSVEQADRLAKSHGTLLRQRGATDLNAIAVLTKLAWMAEHDRERLARARSLLLVKDYIFWRLTGVRLTDPSDAASTGMMDIVDLNWIDELSGAAGFSSSLLPPIRSSTEIAGHVLPDASRVTGLAIGTPVVPGAGDITALAVGCGVSSPGVLGITLGTAGHVVLSQDAKAPFSPQQGLWRIPHADRLQCIWLALVMSGGLSLSWLHRTFLSGHSTMGFTEMAALAESSRPGARGVSFVPFLEGAATPYGQPQARGSFTGLSSSTSAADLVQAVMEGVAFNVRQCVESLEAQGGKITEIRLAEGGARIDRWCQIIADTLERPVLKLGYLDTSSLGAAMMAKSALTGQTLETLSADLARGAVTFAPDPANANATAAGYRRYLISAESEIARSSRLLATES
ncbi:MAG: hypothetical protein JWM58_2524 [Rhizobium sp.]|nr:hypothetical protein [Rhizobium sp.]